MSMSQEEIEALMGGAEVEEELSTDESTIESAEDQNIDDEDQSSPVDDTELNSDDSSDSDNEDEEFEIDDDLLNSIDGMTTDQSDSSDLKERESEIDNNVYPLPVSNENKVVDQLNQVADDSEEKATKIFDVLSFILDENDEVKKYNQEVREFIESQKELLESLAIKFPKVDLFNTNLEKANDTIAVLDQLNSKVDDENNKVFEAMELMQYHDINRQKIERVMSVIKKLSNYLNGIFEDNSGKADVQIAKHISGDSSEIVDSDDIDSLISEFSE